MKIKYKNAIEIVTNPAIINNALTQLLNIEKIAAITILLIPIIWIPMDIKYISI